MAHSYRIDFAAMPWEPAVPGVRFKAFRDGSRQLRLVEFAREFVEKDWCLKGHVGYIQSGQLELAFDGHTVRFQAGDGVFIPAGEVHKHKLTVLSDVVRVMLGEEL